MVERVLVQMSQNGHISREDWFGGGEWEQPEFKVFHAPQMEGDIRVLPFQVKRELQAFGKDHWDSGLHIF